MKRAILLIGLLLAFDVGAALSGNDLMEKCSNTEKMILNYPDGFCDGFVLAVAEVLRNASVAELRACISETATYGQLGRVVGKYLRNHPEQLHHSAHSLVAKALSEAFPCKQ